MFGYDGLKMLSNSKQGGDFIMKSPPFCLTKREVKLGVNS